MAEQVEPKVWLDFKVSGFIYSRPFGKAKLLTMRQLPIHESVLPKQTKVTQEPELQLAVNANNERINRTVSIQQVQNIVQTTFRRKRHVVLTELAECVTLKRVG